MLTETEMLNCSERAWSSHTWVNNQNFGHWTHLIIFFVSTKAIVTIISWAKVIIVKESSLGRWRHKQWTLTIGRSITVQLVSNIRYWFRFYQTRNMFNCSKLLEFNPVKLATSSTVILCPGLKPRSRNQLQRRRVSLFLPIVGEDLVYDIESQQMLPLSPPGSQLEDVLTKLAKQTSHDAWFELPRLLLLRR